MSTSNKRFNIADIRQYVKKIEKVEKLIEGFDWSFVKRISRLTFKMTFKIVTPTRSYPTSCCIKILKELRAK